jgi:hypothetical protein
MRLLREIVIHDFRSIAAASLGGLGDITPLVGLNGSGKSNVLRALNVFFTGYVEAADLLDIRRDFREPRRKAKRRLMIQATLDFGVFESLRREYEESLERLAEGSPLITIRKEWTLHPITREQVVAVSAASPDNELRTLDEEDVAYVTRLLNSIRFRYIPNHIHPSQVLQYEQEAIRKVLVDRLGKKGMLTERTVKALQTGAVDLMGPIAESMTAATGDIAEVELATPEDWGSRCS